jgi:PAS domain S-box-containing protein
MTNEDQPPADVDELLNVPTDVVESEHFKTFLDNVPIAVIIAQIRGNRERVIYANIEFERLSAQAPAQVEGQSWAILDQHLDEDRPHRSLGRVVLEDEEFLGTFRLDRGAGGIAIADAYSNIIEDDEGEPKFRLLALVDVTTRERAQREQLEQQIRDKDLLLKELQHRVKNNLQLITALIRLEARSVRSEGRMPLDRLAGRIESLQLLYQALMTDDRQQEVDLGHYLGQIASAAMRTHGVEGIRLDFKVDYLLMSINIAMPVGLLVNELLTNAFKYAFDGRSSGTITLRCVRLEQERVQISVADDGIGLPDGVEWPPAGKIAALMLRSLRENAKTEWNVETAPDKGTRIALAFSTRLKAQPDTNGLPLTGPFLVSSETAAAHADAGKPSGSAPR